MKKISQFLVIGLFFLSACEAPQERSPHTESNLQHGQEAEQKIEIIDMGQVEVEDRVEEDSWDEEQAERREEDMDFEGYEYYEPTAESRLNELKASEVYQKRNGKLRRLKIARQLNEEGYRRKDGKKFRIRDIPKKN